MSSMPLDVRMGRLEGAYEQIAKRLDTIEVRLDRIDTRFDRFDEKIDALRSEMAGQFRWIVGTIFGTWVTTILTIFFHHSG